MSKTNKTEVDNPKLCNLSDHSDNYSRTSRYLWRHHRDEPNNKTANPKSLNQNKQFQVGLMLQPQKM